MPAGTSTHTAPVVLATVLLCIWPLCEGLETSSAAVSTPMQTLNAAGSVRRSSSLHLRGGSQTTDGNAGVLIYSHPAMGGLTVEGKAAWSITTTASRYVDVVDEPRHQTVFLNEYCRAMEARVAEGSGRTQWHRHGTDSLYIVLPRPLMPIAWMCRTGH
jgi:hypothetical protein